MNPEIGDIWEESGHDYCVVMLILSKPRKRNKRYSYFNVLPFNGEYRGVQEWLIDHSINSMLKWRKLA